ncbi:hypothetical protein H8E07_22795 [bacterium]|nr:hypothetical protein [bacterium]
MRKGKLTWAVLVVLGLVVAPAVASAQSVDLAMTEFTADWDGETLTLLAEVTVSSHGSFDPVATEVGFYLDQYYLGSYPLLLEQHIIGNCHEDMPPDCDGYCEPIYIDDQLTTAAACLAMNWSLQGNLCCCVYVVPMTPYLTPYHGEQTVTATADPQGIYAEGDETNNSMSIALGPIAAETRTWSHVKTLYR